MEDSYYTINKNNKDDLDFLNLVYNFGCNNYMIPKSNKYCVVAHSVMVIKQAIVNITNYQLKYDNKKYRKHTALKENYTNKNCDENNLLLIKTPSYLNDKKDKINLTKYNNIITCVDNSWCTYQYENNRARKNALQDADIYLLSGNKCCVVTSLTSLPNWLPIWLQSTINNNNNEIKLSFGFFTDKKLADLVQNHINYITGGFMYKDIIYFKKKISNSDKLLNLYEKIYKKNTTNINNIKKIVKEYNSNNSHNNSVDITVEPSRYYVYITSNDNNIKNFIKWYNDNKYDYDYELNQKFNMIWNPKVDNGVFIRLNK